MKRQVAPLLLALAAGCSSVSKPRLAKMEELPFPRRLQVAILDFENKTGDPQNDRYVQSIGPSAIAELLKYKRLRLIERQRLLEVLEELRIQMSGLIDPKNAKRVGKQLGVDALLFGSLKAVTNTHKRDSAGIAWKETRRTEVALTARLVHVESGEILSSSEAKAFVRQNRKAAFGFAKTGNMTELSEAVQSALDVATRELANDVARQAPSK